MEVLKSRHSAWLPVVVSLSLIVALAAVVAGCGGNDQETEINGITRVPPAKTKDLTLPDESPQSRGKEIALKGPRDGLMLVYFGYTSCPDVCPTTLADLRMAFADLSPEEREKVQVAMVTVDPKRDTGHVLNGYLGHFFEQGEFHSLRTTNQKQLADAEKVFGASHEIGKPDADGNYDVSHTAQVYAVDDRGKVDVEWAFGTDSELISEDLKQLLDNSQDPGA